MRGSIVKWFKHFSNAHKGGVLQDLYLEFGINEGHGMYFRLIEYLTDKWDGSAEPRFRLLESEVRSFLKVSRKSLRSFAETFEKVPENSFKVSENFCEIYLPKLLEIRHRDAIHSGVRPEKLQPDSGLEKKKRKKKSNTAAPDFLNLESLLAAVPKQTQDGWLKLYAKEFIDRELIRAWNYYADEKPKTLAGWSRALSGWLERQTKWNAKDAANRPAETGGWEHIDGVP